MDGTNILLHRERKLSKYESYETYSIWREDLLESLSEEEIFVPYLAKDFKWRKKTSTNPYRGFTDTLGSTAFQKSHILEMMLLRIATCCPMLAKCSIVKTTTCLEDIWATIELYFGFHKPNIYQ